MWNRISTLLFVILLCQSGCISQNKKQDPSSETIQLRIDQLLAENEVPGINLSIIFENGKQENFSSGLANVEKGIPLSSDHVLFSGSIGKTYAVAILMQLVDEGKVVLKNKISSYFPEIAWLDSLPNIQDITVEMLLRHTSGLPRYVMKPEIWDSLYANPDKVWSYRDRLSVVFKDKPVHEAGKGWAYSDTNYILLGMLIERITGNYYYDEVQNRILGPSALSSTFASTRRDIPNLPIGYSTLPDFFRMPEEVVVDGVYAFNPQMEWTGGGIASTTPDLARWALSYYEGDLFSDSLKQKIVSPVGPGIEIDANLSYGMGSFVYTTPYGEAFGHTGFVPGFVSIFAYYPARKMAVAMQINCDYASNKLALIDYLNQIIE